MLCKDKKGASLNSLTFKIPLRPVPWKRPASVKTWRYDSQKKEKKLYQDIFRKAHPDHKPYTCALKVIFEFWFKVPKYIEKKNPLLYHGEYYDNKPDLSNLIKLVEDAYNGMIWQDDKSIVSLEACKIYEEEEATFVTVYPYL